MVIYKPIFPQNRDRPLAEYGFSATADTNDGSAYKAIDGDFYNSYYRSAITPRLPEYLTITFPYDFYIGRYTIYLGYGHETFSNMEDWEFQGFIGDRWVTLHRGQKTQEPGVFTYDFDAVRVSAVRIKCNSRFGSNSWGIDELVVYEAVFDHKVLIYNQGKYLNFSNNQWEVLNIIQPTQDDFVKYGMDKYSLSSIPISAWQLLTGEIELLHYTDDYKIKESVLSIGTEQFLLNELLDKKEVSIINYKNYHEDSVVNIKTEPFSLYEEFGDRAQILYYTNDPNIDNPKIKMSANYSPLDELQGNYEIVTWTDSMHPLNIEMTALPKPRVVIPLQDLNITSNLSNFILDSKIDDDKYGTIRIAASGDGGLTWKSCKTGKWKTVEITNPLNAKYEWMSPKEVNELTEEQWNELNSKHGVRLAYYISQEKLENIVQINSLKYDGIATIETPVLNNLVIIYDELDKKYSGLMFMDTNQQYYSTSFGEILKYLDMGTLIAGQTSFDINVKLTNTYPFDVRNIFVWSEHDIEGLTVELSKSNNPFIPEKSLLFEQVLRFDEVIDFYVRLKVDSIAEKGGNFDIKVSAEQV